MQLEPMEGKKLSTTNQTYVSSSAVRSIDYSTSSEILELEFINNQVYHYYKVPRQVWEKTISLVKSGKSLGTFVNEEMRKLDVDYRKIITNH
ncbi:MAG TPA: KTSC domain-containing protein [Chitinophagaceae bacterium]|nr:KTSC domain-containing protein [Chitinophagaceae bacterium]